MRKLRRVLLVLGVLAVVVLGAFLYVREPDIPRATLEAKYASAPSAFIMLPDGARAHVRDRGPRNAQTILLLHGSNASLYTWEPWVKRLSGSFRMVTVDLPGHGLTGAVPNGDYSADGMAKFVIGVADALHLDRFVLAGHSMGGRVATRFADKNPERLTQLILVDPAGIPLSSPPLDSLAYKMARTPILNRVLLHVTPRSLIVDGLEEMVSKREIITDGMIEQYWDFVRMQGTRAATVARLNTPSNDSKEVISRIKLPSLLLWGEEDLLFSTDLAREFQALIGGSKLVIYPHTGHVPQEEVADQSAEDVRQFLASK